MDEEKILFSEETERVYKIETESAVVIPDGFKDSVMKKVKVEKMKNKKKIVIALSSVAAILVLAVGVIAISTRMNAFKSLTDEKDFAANENVADNVISNDQNDSDVYSKPEEDEGGYKHLIVYEKDGVSYDWDAFYSAVENGDIDATEESAKKFLENNHEYFEAVGNNASLKQSESIINKVDPFEGYPDADKVNTDVDSYNDLPQMVKVYINLNYYTDKRTGADYNWFEFYNACVEARLDPRYGAAAEYLSECRSFFEERNCKVLLEQANFIIG